MGWSDKQTTLFLRASNMAGWNDQQRYMAMVHVGCPLLASERRPSVKHRGNSQQSFELVMALAESQAEIREVDMRKFPQPSRGTWRELSQQQQTRMRGLITRIAHEAVTELPEKFLPNFLSGFILRMTQKDSREMAALDHNPSELEFCDEGQLYRILEGLKAWVGREFDRVDRSPRSFTHRRVRKEAA